jgi:hypothetical protein
VTASNGGKTAAISQTDNPQLFARSFAILLDKA